MVNHFIQLAGTYLLKKGCWRNSSLDSPIRQRAGFLRGKTIIIVVVDDVVVSIAIMHRDIVIIVELSLHSDRGSSGSGDVLLLL